MRARDVTGLSKPIGWRLLLAASSQVIDLSTHWQSSARPLLLLDTTMGATRIHGSYSGRLVTKVVQYGTVVAIRLHHGDR